MNTRQWPNPWRTYLPEVFSFLDRVTIQEERPSVFDAKAAHILLVKKEKPNKDTMILSSSCPYADLWKKAELRAKALGWKVQGVFMTLVEETPVLLVAESSLPVTPAQKGRQAGLELAGSIKTLKPQKIVIHDGVDICSLWVLDGIFQGLYDIGSFKGPKTKEESESSQISITAIGIQSKSYDQRKAQETIAFAKALTLTKWLEDAPPNYMTPERLAEVAKDLAKEKHLTCTVRGREEIEALGMGCYASVAGGSHLEPQFITIEIPGVDPSKQVVLVGKGLTFDSGGISLKPGQGMEEMKYDMCGGASVIGAAYYLSHVKPKTNVICLIGAVENIPSRYATRPSDIVMAYNKKSVEILNTDAEGRLVLCDLLAYANEIYKPTLMVDIATLTGAVVIALGAFGSAVMTNDQDSADFALRVSKKMGEPLWQMPLWPELAKEIRSDIADYKNITSPSVKGGTISAGQFLKEFVGDTKWLHIDIAGTGWSCKATGYPSQGGSGFGLRILTGLCLEFEG